MSRTLVLVRHGKPEPAGPGVVDFDRKLTPAGIAALEGPDGFNRTFSLLSDEERSGAEIWTSPAVRARQTAQAVGRALDNNATRDCEQLWQQDHAGFLAEVASSTAPCVIAVGHIPFMNEAVAYLTGAAISFKPGGAAAIELPDPCEPASLQQDSCRMLWFVQGPTVAS